MSTYSKRSLERLDCKTTKFEHHEFELNELQYRSHQSDEGIQEHRHPEQHLEKQSSDHFFCYVEFWLPFFLLTTCSNTSLEKRLHKDHNNIHKELDKYVLKKCESYLVFPVIIS